MKNISQLDIDTVTALALQPVNTNDHKKLVDIYQKLEHLCKIISKKGYRYNIRKDPRKQAGTGKFVFQEYQWAKIYPQELMDYSIDKFAYIIGISNSLHFHLMGIKDYQNTDASKFASNSCWTEIDIGSLDYEQIADNFVQFDKRNRKLYIETGAKLKIAAFDHLLKSYKMDEIKKLLEYKKQIILQGPPGTGKTKLAKELAEMLIGTSTRLDRPSSITNQQIIDTLKDVKIIKTVAGNTEYTLMNVDSDAELVTLQKKTEAQDTSNFNCIKESFRTQSFLNDIEGNPNRRTAAIANYIYQNIQGESFKLEDSEQFKLVQFHPSYTYEDFVRGIVAKPNPTGSGVLYVAEDKVLGEFAKKALDNYVDSKKPIALISKEVWIRERIKSFQKYLEEKLDNEEQIWLTTHTAYITRITNDTIRYKGDNWKIDGGVPYADLAKMFLANVSSLTEIRELETLTLSAKSNTTYWHKVLELFKSYLTSNNLQLPNNTISDPISLNKYILIIDEINRANLSSVLGELIYSLEYRGEALDGMYAVDHSGDEEENKKLVLPPNLYIIGTMNTADRSVGHIDYAIRRRFAFVDVPPEKLEDTDEIWFNTSAYEAVEKLFNQTNVTADFDAKDIQIGHSYFIVKKEDAKPEEKDDIFKMKMKYEVIPILNEYVKDGILTPETMSLINEISKIHA